jgi:hypothetical protein
VSTALVFEKHPPSVHKGTTASCTMCDFPPKPDLEALGEELYEAVLQFTGCAHPDHCLDCWARLRSAWLAWANREVAA